MGPEDPLTKGVVDELEKVRYTCVCMYACMDVCICIYVCMYACVVDELEKVSTQPLYLNAYVFGSLSSKCMRL